MKHDLLKAREMLRARPELAGYQIRLVNGELHLAKGSDCFVRLLPAVRSGIWSMQHYHNRKHWQCVDFSGSLEECLDFLSENPHYLFWEG